MVYVLRNYDYRYYSTLLYPKYFSNRHLAAILLVGPAIALGLALAVSIVRNLHNGWASDSVVISWRVVVLGEDDILLTWLSLVWNDDLVLGAGSRELSRDWARGGDEPSSLRIDRLGDGEGELVTWLGNTGWGDRDGWEGDNWELGVAAWALGDELSRERVDLVEVEWDVESGWKWRLGWTLVLADVCRVASLDGEDGASSCEVVLVHDVLGSTEVGTDTNTLKNIGNGKEAGGILEAEVVCAWLGWGDLSSCNSWSAMTTTGDAM